MRSLKVISALAVIAALSGCKEEAGTPSPEAVAKVSYTCASDETATTCFPDPESTSCMRDAAQDRDGLHYVDCGVSDGGAAYLIIPECGVSVASECSSCLDQDCGYNPDVDLAYCASM